MSSEIEVVRRFCGLRALIVGDAMLDSYYLGSATRLSPEGPVPVVRSRGKLYLPGGAANTAANVSALGARATLLATVGADHEGEMLNRQLASRGVDVDHLIVDSGRPTSAKLRIIADGQFVARFDQEDDADLSAEAEGMVLSAFRGLFLESDVVIVSDYMKGVITPALVAELSTLNRGNERLVVVDSKDLSRHRFRNVSVITPNHLEAQKACALQVEFPHLVPPWPALESMGRSLLDRIGTRWVMMTVGAEGALLFEHGRPTVQIRAREVRNPDAVGAGDTFTAALALALGSGADTEMAARIAVEAAAIAVSKRMTAVVEQQELLQRLSLHGGSESVPSLADSLSRYRAEGKRLVLTNGAFDGLHSGHIAFLREARKLGDVLIVGVNSDESLRRVTGQDPLYSEEERLSVVAALDPVDHAVIFDEETPSALIREVRPHVHVKGGDHRAAGLPEAETVREVGGKVVILPLVEPRASDMLRGKLARRGPRRSRAA